MKEFYTYSTEFQQVEEIGILFNTLEEAKKDALERYLKLGCNEEDCNQLTNYFKFKVN